MKFDKMFSIEKSKRESVLVNKIDKIRYLGFSNNTRILLTQYSMSLGVDRPVKVNSKDPLLRAEYIENNNELKTLITCAAINNIDIDNSDEELNEENIFEISQNCMNRGLDIISDEIDNMVLNNFQLNKIEELNSLFKENVK